MKILLHGAINFSNFGDFLFAKIFYEHIKNRGQEVEFYSHSKYGISAFFCKHLGYQPSEKNYKTLMRRCDARVFIAGGYFAKCSKNDIFSRLKHIKRYFLPALYFIKKGKPIYILGVGAGPFGKGLYRKLALKVLNHAEVIHVRNEESKQYCLDLGVTTEIKVTADTALLLKEYMTSDCEIPLLTQNTSAPKAFLLHVNGSSQIQERMLKNVVPAIKCFLENHSEYQLYLAADGLGMDRAYEKYADVLNIFHPIKIAYDDPMQLCQYISKMDIVVTPKLHVGIVASVLGRSVFSFPAVPQKTKRFYKQIGESDRCIPLEEVEQKMVLNMLEEKKDTHITVPQDLIDLAHENLKAIPLR